MRIEAATIAAAAIAVVMLASPAALAEEWMPVIAPEAKPAGPVSAARKREASQPVAVAVNAPFSWDSAISGSVYVRLDNRNAIRGNVAVYDHRPSLAHELVAAAAGGEIETGYSGRTIDAGVGWQYFPHRLYDGAVFEAGVVRRAEDHVEDASSWNSRIEHRRAVGYAARVMVGWSLLYSDRAFLAASVGLSLGRYNGTVETQRTDDDGIAMAPAMTESFGEDKIEAEAYLRLGIAFGN